MATERVEIFSILIQVSICTLYACPDYKCTKWNTEDLCIIFVSNTSVKYKDIKKIKSSFGQTHYSQLLDNIIIIIS